MKPIYIILLYSLFTISCRKPHGYKKEIDFSYYQVDLIGFTNYFINDSTSVYKTHTFYNEVNEPNIITTQSEFNYYYCTSDSTAPGYVKTYWSWCEKYDIDFSHYVIHRIKPSYSDRKGGDYWRKLHKIFIYVNEKDKKLIIYRKERDIYMTGGTIGYTYTYFVKIPNKYKDYSLEYDIEVAKIRY